MAIRLFSALILVTGIVILPAINAYGQDDQLNWRSTSEQSKDMPAKDTDADRSQQDITPKGFGPREFTPDGVVRQTSALGKVGGNTALASAAVAKTSSTSAPTLNLPREHGQIWREYDISPYTLRVTSTKRPEQAVVDWILRETGYEAWHSQPLGILSATPRVLRVYHTPEMQALVGTIVDRFTASEAATQAFGVRVITVDHPNWRTKVHRYLHPVSVQTPGVLAWIVQKEDASAILADLRQRSDFREHSSPHLLVNNGQSTVVSTTQAHTFVRDVTLRPQVFPGFEQYTGQFDEGFSFEFSPLLSIDGRTIDATLKCSINQLEKMVPIMIDAPTQQSPRQRVKVEVPQTTHFRFHERFRWPIDRVLLISMGMVALPASKDKTLVPGVPLPFGNTPARADVLVFIESRGQVGVAGEPNRAGQPPQTAHRESRSYSGRY
ncbi:MAG: hypothetical protein JXM70_00175 [Pirellulales bacterium]|nr:hypothetical protein [Pirellulales bacterium]